jgi:spore maturation protein CgeB
MKTIGFYLNKTNSKTHTVGVNGEELWAYALAKGLNNLPDIKAYVFGENMGFMPEVDIAIYFQADFIGEDVKLLGRQKNIAVMQNYEKTEEGQQRLMDKYFTFKGDKIFTTSQFYSIKHNWKLLMPCVDMDEFKSYPFDEYLKCDLFYIGNNIKDPQKTQKWLTIPNIKYGIYGNGFGRNIGWHDSVKAYSSSILNLNFGFDTSKDIITARIFQIAACKGLVCTEWTESYEKVFGDSMFYIKANDNIQLKLKEYLEVAKSEAGKRMKEKAFEIVKKDYNADIQAKILFDLIME